MGVVKYTIRALARQAFPPQQISRRQHQKLIHSPPEAPDAHDEQFQSHAAILGEAGQPSPPTPPAESKTTDGFDEPDLKSGKAQSQHQEEQAFGGDGAQPESRAKDSKQSESSGEPDAKSADAIGKG